MRLLQVTGALPPQQVGEATLGQQRHALLDVFIEHFRGMLAQQMQLGLIRRYVPMEDELATVRGRIDLVRQVRLNAFSPQRIHCRFDEFDIDNPYNQVLSYVVGMLLHRTHHPAIKRGLNELLAPGTCIKSFLHARAGRGIGFRSAESALAANLHALCGISAWLAS